MSLDISYNPMALDLAESAGFAAAVNAVRNLKEGGTCVIALCCKSYSAMMLGRT